MTKILADHCVPQDLLSPLLKAGFRIETARSKKLDETSDDEIFKYAQKHGYVFLTVDNDFGNIVRFDIRNSHGVVIVALGSRADEMPHKLVRFFADIEKKRRKLEGLLYLLDRDAVRIWPR